MSDRLDELHRQRALAQEQVAWFDGEIARLKGAAPAAGVPVTAAAPTVPPAAAMAPVSDEQTELAAADIIARYNQDKPGNMAKDAKRGCLLYFVFLMCALAIFAAGVYVLYLETR